MSSISSMNRLSKREHPLFFFIILSRSWSRIKSREKWKTRGRRGNRNGDYSNRLTFRRPTLCSSVQQFSYLGQARWHGLWLYSLPYLLLPAIRLRSSTTERRAKDDIEWIGSTKREKKSVRFLLNLVGQRLGIETREWSKEWEERRREINPRTKFEFPNDFHVKRISLVNSHENLF